MPSKFITALKGLTLKTERAGRDTTKPEGELKIMKDLAEELQIKLSSPESHWSSDIFKTFIKELQTNVNTAQNPNGVRPPNDEELTIAQKKLEYAKNLIGILETDTTFGVVTRKKADKNVDFIIKELDKKIKQVSPDTSAEKKKPTKAPIESPVKNTKPQTVEDTKTKKTAAVIGNSTPKLTGGPLHVYFNNNKHAQNLLVFLGDQDNHKVPDNYEFALGKGTDGNDKLVLLKNNHLALLSSDTTGIELTADGPIIYRSYDKKFIDKVLIDSGTKIPGGTLKFGGEDGAQLYAKQDGTLVINRDDGAGPIDLDIPELKEMTFREKEVVINHTPAFNPPRVIYPITPAVRGNINGREEPGIHQTEVFLQPEVYQPPREQIVEENKLHTSDRTSLGKMAGNIERGPAPEIKKQHIG